MLNCSRVLEKRKFQSLRNNNDSCTDWQLQPMEVLLILQKSKNFISKTFPYKMKLLTNTVAEEVKPRVREKENLNLVICQIQYHFLAFLD